MKLKDKLILTIPYLFLAIISFSINHWTGSRGLFPIDTFVHFDSGIRILQNELPVRDFWIVHGILIDYIQAAFFWILGISWQSYLLHGSIMNVILTLMTFKIFIDFKIEKNYALAFSICFAILAYPVSGTPFLDLHSAHFSLISMYLFLLFIKNEDYTKLFVSIFLLGMAFLCKQVPAAYFIILLSLFLLLNSLYYKNLKPIIISFLALIAFLGLIFFYLLLTKTNIQDFILQLFIFPTSIGTDRHSDILLNLNNVFSNFKFIHILIFLLTIILLINIYKKNFINPKKEISYFIILIFFSVSLVFHQIYTKNQIFIFFIIPILSGFCLYYFNKIKYKQKKFFSSFLIIFCFAVTLKYHFRFNEMRKFHELSNTNINSAIEVKFKKPFFNGLKWITPNYKNPKNELKIIEDFYLKVSNREDKNMIISRYTFLSGMLKKSVHTPSRTFDDISYPMTGTEYYDKYNLFFKKNLIKNEIENIFLFNPGFKLSKKNLNNVIFNYLPKDCYIFEDINDFTKKIKIINCNYLEK